VHFVREAHAFTVCQIDDPVNPITVRTPNAAAARAVSLTSAAAR
jgi:hypothetical protein